MSSEKRLQRLINRLVSDYGVYRPAAEAIIADAVKEGRELASAQHKQIEESRQRLASIRGDKG